VWISALVDIVQQGTLVAIADVNRVGSPQISSVCRALGPGKSTVVMEEHRMGNLAARRQSLYYPSPIPPERIVQHDMAELRSMVYDSEVDRGWRTTSSRENSDKHAGGNKYPPA
jgi:hypothetical protein